MAIPPRAGQIIALIFMLGTAGLLIATFFFPFLVITVSNSVCTWYQFRQYDSVITECPDVCTNSGGAVPSCYDNFYSQNHTTRCEPTIQNWKDFCTSPTAPYACQRQAWITFGVWISQIVTCCFLAIALLLFVLSMFVMSAGAAIGLMFVASFFALVGVIGYSVGYPIGTKEDYINWFDVADCGNNISVAAPWVSVGCNGFTGTVTSSCEATNYSWGPGIGWILYCAAMILAWITAVVMMLVGRGQKKLNAL